MSKLATKSDENLKAAKTLLYAELYNASVHCSYYGCFQFMKCLLNNNLDISYTDQDRPGSDSHMFVFGKLEDCINKIPDMDVLSREFRVQFLNLRGKRRKSDYQNQLVDEAESWTAFGEADKAISALKKMFGVIKLKKGA